MVMLLAQCISYVRVGVHMHVSLYSYSLLSRKDNDAISTNDIIIFVSVLLHALRRPLKEL